MDHHEFKLLSMRIFDGLDKHFKATRNEILPSKSKLMKLRECADSAGIQRIEDDGLTIELEGDNGSFWLEYGSTGVRVGRVGINRRINYRLIWLIDGRTMEIVNDRISENAAVFLDGVCIGVIMAQAQIKYLKLLPVRVSWSISIDDTTIFRVRYNEKTMREMTLIRHRAPDVHAWVGQPRQANLAKFLWTNSHRAIKTRPPPNDRWFLPRSSGQLLHRNNSERLALLAFALQFRQAYWKIN